MKNAIRHGIFKLSLVEGAKSRAVCVKPTAGLTICFSFWDSLLYMQIFWSELLKWRWGQRKYISRVPKSNVWHQLWENFRCLLHQILLNMQGRLTTSVKLIYATYCKHCHHGGVWEVSEGIGEGRNRCLTHKMHWFYILKCNVFSTLLERK